MKLWKANKLDQEYEISNEEIAKQFMQSRFYPERHHRGTSMALICFISANETEGGLNSTWEWDEEKGSINGSPDLLQILDVILPKLEKKEEA